VVVAALVAMTAAPAWSPAGADVVSPGEDVFAFGDAGFFGSTGAVPLARPLVGMAATPTGDGYWLAASDGGVFAYGGAGFFGSTGSLVLNRPVVGMAATPAGDGYWLVGADGGIFSFGAPFLGSLGGTPLPHPVVGMAADPSGAGYWLATRDGDVRPFGSATPLADVQGLALHQPIAGIAATPTGEGYWLVATSTCAVLGTTADKGALEPGDVINMTDLRTGAVDCVDRVTFQFVGISDDTGNATIGATVGYRSPPFVGPPGFPIPVDGGAFLEVHVRGASTFDSDIGVPTYTGPQEVKPGLRWVR
jgi:hypothetical protein